MGLARRAEGREAAVLERDREDRGPFRGGDFRTSGHLVAKHSRRPQDKIWQGHEHRPLDGRHPSCDPRIARQLRRRRHSGQGGHTRKGRHHRVRRLNRGADHPPEGRLCTPCEQPRRGRTLPRLAGDRYSTWATRSISYGDFLENNKTLGPSPYVTEWWLEDLKAASQAQRQVASQGRARRPRSGRVGRHAQRGRRRPPLEALSISQQIRHPSSPIIHPEVRQAHATQN